MTCVSIEAPRGRQRFDQTVPAELPENLDLLPTDDRERFVHLYQEQTRKFRPADGLERSYVGYIAMALFRYEQLIAIENSFRACFPAGAPINFENISPEGCRKFQVTNDHQIEHLRKSLQRDQRFYQASCTHWQKILRDLQRHFPAARP